MDDGCIADILSWPEVDRSNEPRLKEAMPAKVRHLRSVPRSMRGQRTQDHGSRCAVAPASKAMAPQLPVPPQRKAEMPTSRAAAVPSRVEELLAMILGAKIPPAREQGTSLENKDSPSGHIAGPAALALRSLRSCSRADAEVARVPVAPSGKPSAGRPGRHLVSKAGEGQLRLQCVMPGAHVVAPAFIY